MGDMVRIARMLRVDHGFKGYIHLKTIPDAAPELVAEAGLFADRLSVNIELPTGRPIRRLAPEKRPETIRAAMARCAPGARCGQGQVPHRQAPAALRPGRAIARR